MRRPRGQFTEHTAEQMSKTLGQKLIKTVDQLRDQHTRFGLRPYTVKIVRVRWTGGTRGDGAQIVVREDKILPTPKVQDLASLRDVLEPVGRTEEGELLITEISGRYSEGFLRGVDADGTPPTEDEQIFWLIEYQGQARGGTVEKRWFQPSTAPGYKADRFEWTITLMRTDTSDGFGEVT